MSKKQGKTKQKRVEIVAVNKYRKIALISNPLILLVLVICVFFGMPFEAVLALAVVAYAIWGYFFVRAQIQDRKIHGKKKR